MSEKIKERSEIEQQYKWDLSSLFKSDEDFEEALKNIDEQINVLAKYQGKLNNADNVLEFLQKETDVLRKVSNIYNYASLRNAENTTDEIAQSMSSRAVGKFVLFQTVTAYVQPEFLALDDQTLESIMNDEKLKDYKFFLERLLRLKKHTLSVEEEEILAQFSETLEAAGDISSYLMNADMVYEDALDSKGNKHELTDSNFILLQFNEDRILRENAFRNYYKTYKGHINTLTSAYSSNVKASTTMAKVRHYESSREMQMALSNIPTNVYDQLVDTVHKHMKTMHDYVSFRKRMLKVDELHYYDVYTPLVSSIEKTYSYEQAQEIILDALMPLGKDYTDVVASAFKDRWLDVYPNKGKRGGAFSSGTYDSNPFILTNFTGTLDSVSTIAHEMGHSMHSYLANHHQPAHYSDYTLFVAEVASTVNENLLIEKLLKDEKDPQARLALLNQYLENFKGTVYRQTMFAEFEKKAHEIIEEGGALTPAILNGIYSDLIKQYFGEDLVFDEEIQYEWSRIPHFYRPFYVYVYATGYSTAVAISEKILNEGEEAVKKYKEFLSMGSSAYPLDELKHAGVDLNTPEPIDIALNKFRKVLDEATAIADELGL